jgi:hypothetical protein
LGFRPPSGAGGSRDARPTRNTDVPLFSLKNPRQGDALRLLENQQVVDYRLLYEREVFVVAEHGDISGVLAGRNQKI